MFYFKKTFSLDTSVFHWTPGWKRKNNLKPNAGSCNKRSLIEMVPKYSSLETDLLHRRSWSGWASCDWEGQASEPGVWCEYSHCVKPRTFTKPFIGGGEKNRKLELKLFWVLKAACLWKKLNQKVYASCTMSHVLLHPRNASCVMKSGPVWKIKRPPTARSPKRSLLVREVRVHLEKLISIFSEDKGSRFWYLIHVQKVFT